MKSKFKKIAIASSLFSLTTASFLVASCFNIIDVDDKFVSKNQKINISHYLSSKTTKTLPSEMNPELVKEYLTLSFMQIIDNKPKQFDLKNTDYQILSLVPNNSDGSLKISILLDLNKKTFSFNTGSIFQTSLQRNNSIGSKYESTAIYTLEQMKELSKNPYDFIYHNPYYQMMLERANKTLSDPNNRTELNINEWLQQTGYGEYGNSVHERLNLYKKIDFEQKNIYKIQDPQSLTRNVEVLDVYIDPTTNNQYSVNADEIAQLIDLNPFGKLPTNFPQFMSSLDVNEYIKLIKIVKNSDKENIQVKDVYYRIIDRYAELEVIFEIYNKQNNSKHYIGAKFNKNNSSLARNEDYFKYIFDRTISLGYLQTTNGEEAVISSGTGWIVDRIYDESLPSNDYVKVLVATNNHVVDFSGYYKPRNLKNEKTRWFTQEEYAKYLIGEHKRILPYETYIDKERYKYLLWGATPKKSSVSNELNLLSGVDFSTLSKVYNISAENYLDRTWYIPSLTAEGVEVDGDLRTWYKTKDNVGYITNGTVDFVLVPMVLKVSDIKEKLPSYYEVLNTPKEAAWYSGLGNSTKYLPQLEVFSGGYPGTKIQNAGYATWSGLKGYGALVQPFDRTISNESVLNYVGPKTINNNTGFEKLENGGYVHKLFNVGSRIITSNQIGELGSGSSGSMMIDANFNVIGIHFAGLESQGVGTSIGNLFVAQSQDLSGDTDIAKAVVNKLKKENIYTYKLNPKA